MTLTSSKPLMFLVSGIIVGAVAGYVAAQTASTPDARVLGSLAACESKLAEARGFFTSIPTMTSFAGTVRSVEGSVVTVEIPPSGNPFDEYPTTREVVVGESTAIVRQGSPESRKLTPDELSSGDHVTVTADHNVKMEARFTAVTIEVASNELPSGAAPLPTATPRR